MNAGKLKYQENLLQWKEEVRKQLAAKLETKYMIMFLLLLFMFSSKHIIFPHQFFVHIQPQKKQIWSLAHY